MARTVSTNRCGDCSTCLLVRRSKDCRDFRKGIRPARHQMWHYRKAQTIPPYKEGSDGKQGVSILPRL
jgi:hypothetical protein